LLQRNRLVEHPIEGRIEVTGRRGKRRKELPDDFKEKRGYWKVKRGSTRWYCVENSLCQRIWSTRKTRLRNPTRPRRRRKDNIKKDLKKKMI